MNNHYDCPITVSHFYTVAEGESLEPIRFFPSWEDANLFVERMERKEFPRCREWHNNPNMAFSVVKASRGYVVRCDSRNGEALLYLGKERNP